MVPRADTQRFEDAEPDIGIGRIAATVAVGREHHQILLGATTAPDRLSCCAQPTLAEDERGSIASAALEHAAQAKPKRAMWFDQHRLVVQHHLAARLAPQNPQVAGCQGSYHIPRTEV